MARTGRRPGDADTRGAILAAARSAFAAHGYHSATIRGIAGEAGVDPALVHHYFGTKEDLFGAAISLPLRPAEAAELALAGGMEAVGLNLTRLFFSIWENPASRDSLLALLRGAFTTEQAAQSLREFFQSSLMERIADQIQSSDAGLRVALVAAHLVGIAVLRYVVRFEALRRVSVDELVEAVAPRVQSYLTG